MKEIEIKAHLKNPEKVISKITELGCTLSSSVKQIDTVYTKIVGNVEEYLTNEHFLRIRKKSDGRFIFTVKKPLSKTVLNKMEYETEIKDAKALEQALFLMGYQIANKVIKSRKTASYKEFEICLDEVESLGSFIEVEKMAEDNVDEVRKEIQEFLFSLGVALEDEVKKGYDIMAIENNLNK